jgi:hypothetical protein
MFMRRLIILIFSLVLSLSQASSMWIHYDYDYKGASLAKAAYEALARAEAGNTGDINDLLNHYASAEVASAGIWLSKFLDRKALKDEMIFSSAENHYYKVILFLVTKRITPRLVSIGKYLLDYPEQFLYWGPYLYKTSDDVMNLCAQFEAIVCNGKKGFSSSDFFQISPALQEYFDFSKLGNVNWQETWDRITNFPTPKWEDFREDFKELFSAVSPVNLAIAGEESIKGNASHIFDRLAEAPQSIPEMISQVQDVFQDLTSGAAVKRVLEGVVGDLKDSLAVTRLFDIGNYNIGNYVKDYVSQLKGEFYTQLWYIYRVEKTAGSYYKQNFVIQCNGAAVYNMEYDSRTNKGDFDKKMTEMVAAYRKMYPDDRVEIVAKERVRIDVPYGQGREEIVYDQLFDSRINHETVFEKEFNQRIETLMKDQEVDYPWLKVEYKIGKGEKYYYEFESAETVRNTASASFTVNCYDEVELAKGSFNFKVNERYDPSKKNEYAYPKGMVAEKKPEDTSLWEQKIEEYQNQIAYNEDKISEYQSEAKELQAVADTTSNISEKKRLEDQAYILNSNANKLIEENIDLQDKLKEVQDVFDEYQIDYSEDLDGPYRIPTLENDMAGDFHLHWDAEGSWSGNTYTRPAHIVGMDSPVKFIAEVKEERDESWFWFIRYHRAIIGVEFRLVSEQETSEVADVIEFSDDITNEEKANLINQKRSEVQAQFPSCNVTVVKNEKEPPEKDDKNEAFHLLWMSDRVALARFIEYRLRQIDGQLSFIERNLYIKKNMLDDFKKAFLQGVPRWRTSSPGGAALQRWLNVGNGIAVNKGTE